MYASIQGLRKNLSNVSDLLLLPEVEMLFFCSEILVSSWRHISELTVSSFGRPIRLLRGEVDRFPGLAFRHIDSVVISVNVVES